MSQQERIKEREEEKRERERERDALETRRPAFPSDSLLLRLPINATSALVAEKQYSAPDRGQPIGSLAVCRPASCVHGPSFLDSMMPRELLRR